jgi:hypothetical protein
MPDIGHEQGNVAGLGNDGKHTASFPLQIVVGQPVSGWRLSRRVAARNDPGRPRIDWTVPEEEMRRDGKDWIGDPRVPRNTRITRHMGPAVDVPEASEVPVVAA